MHEQFGGVYWQLPQYVSTPLNNTYVRLFRDLTPGANFGLYFIKKSDGSIELFSAGLVPGGAPLSAIFQNIATVGNIGAGQDTLYSNSIAAGKLAVNGDEISAQYSMTLANTLNAKTIRLSFGGINIFTSVNDYSTGTEFDLDLKVSIMRVSATDAKVIVSYTANGITETQNTTITPLDFTIANTLLLTGEGVADNDLVANFAKGIFIPTAV